jgi:hypothetical protein
MGSSSGTHVNGSKVHKAKLNHGDQILIGETSLMVGVGSPAGAQQAAALTAAAGGMPAPGVAPMVGAPGMAPPMGPGGMPPGMPMQPPGMQAPGFPPQAQMPQPGMQPPGMTAQPPLGMSPAQSMPGGVVAPGTAQMAPAARPGAAQQPRFDDGAGGQEARRATRDRVFAAAVESRPHPSLPPEEQLTAENRVLEMRAYWGEVLLRVSHYHEPKRITLGEAKGTDFFISSEGLPVEVFPFIRFIDGEYVLTITKQMDGEIEVDGELHPFETVRGSSRAKKDSDLEDSYQVALGLKSRALVHWGGATCALRFVAPAKAPPKQFFQNLDLEYVNILVLSLLFHLATVFTMMFYPYDTDALQMDLFDDDAGRFAEIVLKGPTENESTEDLLERIKKKVEEKKEELKPPEETKPDVKLKETPKVVKREKTKQERQAEVKQRFSKLFSSGSGAAGGALLGGGGGGTLAGTLSNVIGTTGAGSATAGLAGLGIRGSGPMTGGGIGTSRGIAGIGTSGRAGGGGFAYGSGIGIGKKVNRDMISLSTPVVMGALPKEAIQRVINQNKAQIRYCYEVELQRNQNLEGRINMSWIIAATGSVAKVQIKESTMKAPGVERCIASKIKTWKFPAPSGGGIVEVNYPFVFRAG